MLESFDAGPLRVAFVEVDVTHQVVGYMRTLVSGEVLDVVELDMPPQTLHTRSVMYTLTPEALEGAGVEAARFPGALHAAEHAAIGLLPLIATCDRWDIGGLSTNLHPDTDLPTVFVYDGYPVGRDSASAATARSAPGSGPRSTRLTACRCETGCPSCVQSPKCGNGNDPLDKAGAIAVLRLVLDLAGD